MSVYFITAREVDLVKIGYAFNPVARFNHLRTSSPIGLALEGAIFGGFEKERELHERYAKHRVRGEWFMITSEIEDEIAASTRPEKYTWASVRLWLKALAKDDPGRRVPTAERHVTDESVQDALIEKARLSSMPKLKRLEARGDIHFPFRQLETETS